MKLMSMKVSMDDVDSTRKLLADHDAAVFKVIELTDAHTEMYINTIAGHLQIIYCQILFYVMSDDAETFLKLKFPANTFESVDT